MTKMLAILLLAAAVFFASAALFAYVLFKFFSLALALDAHFLREFRMRPPVPQGSPKPDQGDFVPYSDEEAWAAEATGRAVREGAITDEDITNFLRHGVGAATGKEP
jgi:hypothetical protein